MRDGHAAAGAQSAPGAAMIAPPTLHTADGRVRRIGVEIEFFGPSVDRAARLVARLFGGTVEMLDPHRARIAGGRFGDFLVELDSIYAHPEKWRAAIEAPDGWQGTVERLCAALGRTVGDVAGLWLPVEIVAPPVPLAALGELEQIIPALRALGAEGTDQGLIFAFGTQLNIEMPALTAEAVLAYLKAYLLLSPWLREAVGPDQMRQFLPFIDPFPEAYAVKVIDPGYRPDLPELVRDYLAANPTRNRELDLLPLFAAAGQPLPELEGKGVKARPALHYRLPDTRLSDPGWGLIAEWNRWVAVERLAGDRIAQIALAAASRGADGGLADRAVRLAAIKAWRGESG